MISAPIPAVIDGDAGGRKRGNVLGKEGGWAGNCWREESVREEGGEKGK